MRFAVDAHAIGRNLTGNEVYIRSLLHAFAGLDRESEFVAYVCGDSAELAIPHGFDVRRISANPFVRLGVDLSRHLRRDKPDLVHVQYTAPLACPVPVVASVHDVSFLEHPEYFTRARRTQLRITVAHTVRRAAKVITGSEFARESILRAYHLPDDRVVSIPFAASPRFRAINPVLAMRKVQERFPLRGPFVLSVGDLQPRKNHVGLIRAFASLIKAHPKIKHQLVLAGKDTWYRPRVREAARESGIADRILFTGFVTDQDLLHLYNACDCFTFPSFYEGFGLPILEAMACGRAVVSSNTSSMPEVADGAGILFDPHNEHEIARAMADVLLDTQLRTRMERMGLQRAAHFNWQRTAAATLDVYREVTDRMRETRPAAVLRP